MFFFFHLVVGAVLGLALARWRKDTRFFYAGILGSALPDLIDKPLGELVLAQSLGYGRIFFHSLTMVCLFAVAGILLYRNRWSSSLLVVTGGMFVHQVFDEMWTEPVNWFWPFFGPFTVHHQYSNLLDGVIAEISAPSEWIFFLALIGIIILAVTRNRNTSHSLLIRCTAMLLPVLFGGVAIVAFLVGEGLLPVSVTGLAPASHNLVLSAGALIAAIVLPVYARWAVAGDP
ncbi:MAG: metal-dependent hydrolase [Methanomicrobiales archaeon]|nr:metal-dependent hydrolase [Methanomicrobiales archaeon]